MQNKQEAWKFVFIFKALILLDTFYVQPLEITEQKVSKSSWKAFKNN